MRATGVTSKQRTPIAGALLALLLVLLAPELGAAAQTPGSKSRGGTCLVCGTATGATDPVLEHRGRAVRLHPGACEEHWLESPEHFFARLQPAGALFQEERRSLGALHGPWFWLGIYAVLGLLSSAVAAYLAVNRGQPPAVWFFAGLFGNLAALAVLVFVIPRGDGDQLPAGIPRGLAKVPVTRAPRACTSCGSAMHPAASACPACGESVDPLVASEVRPARKP